MHPRPILVAETATGSTYEVVENRNGTLLIMRGRRGEVPTVAIARSIEFRALGEPIRATSLSGRVWLTSPIVRATPIPDR